MLKKINHIGIAVRSIESGIAPYRALGLEPEGEEVVEEQKVRVVFLTVGESRIELLEPTSPDSPVAKFIEKKGEGIHHIAFQVENIEEALAQAEAQGLRLIDKRPRSGAHGTRIAFLHPKSTGGVLMELCKESHG
jgi:methylmalonyl-CoA/ethylmalonyl-CoA epimerase